MFCAISSVCLDFFSIKTIKKNFLQGPNRQINGNKNFNDEFNTSEQLLNTYKHMFQFKN